ncbi:DNA-primase RepB domain-containing protein [Ruegeria lacuscaerulensis]|uniref:DNA-primase RepB domain-containing protein n=1 Tax=Ruegeria lacuscaerulensis TaxID=55218 RepID=UPI00147D0162|nr:DNA-primase RepB domain-containing protein [Ruegeria lacuscaerulensis]
MPDSMPIIAFSECWKENAATLLTVLWSDHYDGDFVFVATRSVDDRKWVEHALQLPVKKKKLTELFTQYDRKSNDIYFCANSFSENRRLRKFALPTRYACCDIDDADYCEFQPEPILVWETSPGRTQSITIFKEKLTVDHAEQIARNLAYSYGADKNGWSVTKYLRVPFSINHKPEYNRPEVEMAHTCHTPFAAAVPAPKFILEPKKRFKRTKAISPFGDKGRLPKPSTGRKYAKRILKKYRIRLKLFPRALLSHEILLYRDRSAAIYAIIAGLHAVGAKRSEIENAVWNSVYFLDKYGRNLRALDVEVTRIIDKLEGRHSEK